MFKFEFTEQDLLIMDTALKQMPYGQVVALINKINEQIQEQVAKATMIDKEF